MLEEAVTHLGHNEVVLTNAGPGSPVPSFRHNTSHQRYLIYYRCLRFPLLADQGIGRLAHDVRSTQYHTQDKPTNEGYQHPDDNGLGHRTPFATEWKVMHHQVL